VNDDRAKTTTAGVGFESGLSIRAAVSFMGNAKIMEGEKLSGARALKKESGSMESDANACYIWKCARCVASA
jgi:hypothetical protein